MATDPPAVPAPSSPSPPAPPRSAWERARSDPRPRRLLKWAIPVLAAAIVGSIAGVTVASAIRMPRADALATFRPALITRLVDRDGEAFASYARQRRVMLSQDEIPDLLRNAVIAIEDKNFYQHGGLDATGVLRAVLTNLQEGRRAEGASTLTMQLARQLFLSPEKLWRRKIEEALLAVELEKSYSKEQLLTLYINVVFMGHQRYGMESASQYFFAKSVSELTLPEAATLAGIPQRPSAFSPYRAPEAVVKRRNMVLRRMAEDGYIGREELAEALAAPLEVVDHLPQDSHGRYFAEDVRRYLDEVYGSAQLLEGGLTVETTLDLDIQRSVETAVREGLMRLDRGKGWRGPVRRVEGDPEQQTLDSWREGGALPGRWFEGIVLESNRTSALIKVGDQTFTLTPGGMEWTGRGRPDRALERGDVAWFQLRAPEAVDGDGDGDGDGDESEEQAAAEPMLYLEQEPELQAAAVVLESATGAIRALQGGWDFRRNQYNRATQAARQPGSAFKLFVYGAALEAGYTAADTIYDAPVYFLGADNRLSYSPRNYYANRYYGIVTLRRALAGSYNVSAVKLLDLVGADRVIDFARRAGITSELQPYPSLALGAAEVTPLDLAAAYAAIANQGTWVEPYLIDRITDPEGVVIEKRVANTRTVTTPALAYVLTHMLEGVIDHGTAKRLRDLPIDIAGKTGTTNDYTDAWFVGFTPRYTVLVWVGYDIKRSIGRGMDGSRVAVPVWRDIAATGLEKGWLNEDLRFAVPPGVTTAWVEYESGLKADPGDGSRAIEEAFVAGTEPVQPYTGRWGVIAGLPWYQQRPFYIPKEGERMPEDFRLAGRGSDAEAGGQDGD